MHFRTYAPEKISYAINRYAYEAQRHFGILDARLAKQKYMRGRHLHHRRHERWGYARSSRTCSARAAGPNSPNSKRVIDEIRRGPRRRRAVTLKDRHRFKAEMDDAAQEGDVRLICRQQVA